MNSFRTGSEEAYSDNMVELPVFLSQDFGAGATSQSWRPHSGRGAESSALASRNRTRGETPRDRDGGNRQCHR